MQSFDTSLRQITDRIHAAVAARTPLRPRGGGSKDFYGESLQGDLLDLTALSGITSYEPTELVVTARTGTSLMELEAVLAEKGQCLAFEPPHFGATETHPSTATVGGMVAAGLSGPARASAGSVRDYVLGVQLINGKGELLTFGGQVMKNVAGYDVSRLMVGALGALGVLTEISLKVLPVAPAEATLMCGGIAQQAALDLLNRWGGQPLPLNASCWVHDDSATPPRDYLFVRLRGAVAAVDAALPRLMADVQTLGGDAVRMDNAQAGPDWDACRNQTLPFFKVPAPDLCLWRLSVPQTAVALKLPFAQFIEWHGAQRWLWAPLSAQTQLRQAAAAVGGTATLFIATSTDNTGATGRFNALTPALAHIHQRLKNEFDPAGIFSRGRMYPEF
ncbi:MAG: glycolate oxidase subunit GlcE [Rhodoferax sp.]|uniref:glycolate oxidase subunit GlcE n=1 Tax=Rhodoferax sp. TaxID=50421 RepID=UPI0030179DD2